MNVYILIFVLSQGASQGSPTQIVAEFNSPEMCLSALETLNAELTKSDTLKREFSGCFKK